MKSEVVSVLTHSSRGTFWHRRDGNVGSLAEDHLKFCIVMLVHEDGLCPD